MKIQIRTSVALLALVCISAFLYSAFIPLSEKYLIANSSKDR